MTTRQLEDLAGIIAKVTIVQLISSMLTAAIQDLEKALEDSIVKEDT